MSETTTVTDARGRKIRFRKLTVLDQAKILRVIGRANPADAQNVPFVTLATLACAVEDIDGAPQPTPQRPEDIDAIIGRLGDDGFAAVQVEAEKRRAELEEAARAAAEAEAELVKKSTATPISSTPAG